MTVLDYIPQDVLSEWKAKWETEVNILNDYWYDEGISVKQAQEVSYAVQELKNLKNEYFTALHTREKLGCTTELDNEDYTDLCRAETVIADFEAAYPETVAPIQLSKLTEKRIEAGVATCAVYADCVEIKVPSLPTVPPQGGIRDVCKGFSQAARWRFKKKLAKLRLNGLYCFFVTLTYPGKYVNDARVWKRDLDNFRKSFERHFPDFVGGFWHPEIQKRGAVHFHMMLVSDKPCSEKALISFCQTRWPDLVRKSYEKHCLDGVVFESEADSETASHFYFGQYEDDYAKHKVSGHNVQFMKTRDMVQNYITKYISKASDIELPDDMGRTWGMWQFNGKKLDFDAYETTELSKEEIVYLRRNLRKYKESENRLSPSEETAIKRGKLSGITDRKLSRKLRRHKRDKKYARRIIKQKSITIPGIGMESKGGDGSTIKKIVAFSREAAAVKGRQPDLINLHISPQTNVPIEIESLADGTQGDINGSKDSIEWQSGDRVDTPMGYGSVGKVSYCIILKRLRVTVYLDRCQSNGVKMAVFDVSACELLREVSCNARN